MLELGNPLLRQPAQPVTDARDGAVQALITDLWDTLHDFQQRNGWGRALTAPVIGVGLRVVVLQFEEQPYVLINPRLESWSRTQTPGFETCLTFGGIWGEVYRPAQVTVVALDAHGQEQRIEADGVLARMIQHEIDHLDGLVWLDREPDPLTICTTREYLRRQAEQQQH